MTRMTLISDKTITIGPISFFFKVHDAYFASWNFRIADVDFETTPDQIPQLTSNGDVIVGFRFCDTTCRTITFV